MRMNVRALLKIVLVLALVLGFSAVAFASAKNEYARGVSAFNSLLANEKRAGLRAEWEAVMKPFLRSLGADPKSEYAPRSMFFLGRCYEELARRSFSRADRLKALEAYDRMLATYPKHGWSDDALYRMGLIWQEQFKDPAKAAQMFKTLVDTYPKGDKVPEALERLAKIQGPGSVKTETAAKAQPTAVKPAQSTAAADPKKAAPEPAKLKEGLTLLGIRHWSSPDYTRVVMDVTQNVHYERTLVEKTAGGNKQLQITLQQAGIDADVMPSRTIQDGILSHIEVGRDPVGGARVTLDLISMDNYRVFTLPDPYRVVIDIYGTGGGTSLQPEAGAAASSPAPTPPSGGELDHVQAALAELQAKQAAEPKKEVAVKQAAQAPAAKTPAVQPKPPAQTAAKGSKPSEAKTPEIKVSSTQKKYTGSLVEQLGLKVRTVMIDPGHGGKDPGAVANGLREKDINLRMARILGTMLKEQGFEVHYTRTTDKFIPLEERTAMANARNADLFISVHCNAYKDTSAKGFEVYYLNLATDAQAVRVAARENGVSAKKISDMQFILSDLMLNSKINESRQMASMVEEETLRVMRPKYALASHGSKGAFFYVLTGARMPSILVELGYLTNPAEAKRLNTDAYLTTMAQGLTRGVLAYKKKLERFALNESGNS
jgi:N-acetylmuramoyl-L-alanine amidase